MIRTYSFHGGELRNYSEREVLRYEQMGSMFVRRKHGRIVSARFRPPKERTYTPCRATGTEGVRFTHLEQIGARRRIIAHNRLPYAALSDDLTQVQREQVMRAAFSAVQLSVLNRL